MRWKRTILLAALLAGLFSIALGDGGTTAARVIQLSKKAVAAVAASLTAPLALLDERSPGGRGRGALLSTKSEPRERVLPTVRNRLTPLANSPIVNIDIPPGMFAPTPRAQAVEPILPDDLTLGGLVSQPFIDFPGSTIAGLPGSSGGSSPPSGGSSPPSGGSSSPSGGPSPPSGGSSPLAGGASPQSSTVPVPEPTSWSILIFGILALGVAYQRRCKPRR